jgi:hypothetical protein
VNPRLTQREGAILVPDLQCYATHLNKDLHARLLRLLLSGYQVERKEAR